MPNASCSSVNGNVESEDEHVNVSSTYELTSKALVRSEGASLLTLYERERGRRRWVVWRWRQRCCAALRALLFGLILLVIGTWWLLWISMVLLIKIFHVLWRFHRWACKVLPGPTCRYICRYCRIFSVFYPYGLFTSHDHVIPGFQVRWSFFLALETHVVTNLEELCSLHYRWTYQAI